MTGAGSRFVASVYRSMEDDQLATSIERLERFTVSLERAGNHRMAQGYRDSLDAARAEWERRRV